MPLDRSVPNHVGAPFVYRLGYRRQPTRANRLGRELPNSHVRGLATPAGGLDSDEEPRDSLCLRATGHEPYGLSHVEPLRTGSVRRANLEFMDDAAALDLVNSALDLLCQRDGDLPPAVGERCFAHRLAVYIEELLRRAGQSWSVDTEYNRSGERPKEVVDLKGLRSPAGHTRTGHVTPDIIVHKRGTAGPNIMAIEIKRVGEPVGDDEMKLGGYKNRLRYAHAFMVVVSLRRAECRVLAI